MQGQTRALASCPVPALDVPTHGRAPQHSQQGCRQQREWMLRCLCLCPCTACSLPHSLPVSAHALPAPLLHVLLLTSPCCTERARDDKHRDKPTRWHLTWHHAVFCRQSCPSPRPTAPGRGGQAGGSQPRARQGCSLRSNRLSPKL